LLATLACLLVALFSSVLPAWRKVQARSAGADFSTYYYALQVAAEGGNPYDNTVLTERARHDLPNRQVFPFLYPPPFLLGMLWARPLSLSDAYRASFWINQMALVVVLSMCWAWFRADPLLLALLAATFTPITGNASMGQVNLLVLIAVILALWRSSGVSLGAGILCKVAPALALAWWAVRRLWKPIAIAVAVAVGLSLLAIPLVAPSVQLHYYSQVIPTFPDGNYNDLTVPIGIPGNHSLADLYRHFWPGSSRRLLSGSAHLATLLVGITLVGVLAALTRKRRDALGEACGAGAWVALMVMLPVYTYEHHLTLLLLPVAAAVQSGVTGRLHWGGWVATVVGFILLAQPLSFVRRVGEFLPGGMNWYPETKLLGILLVGAVCLWVHRRSGEEVPA